MTYQKNVFLLIAISITLRLLIADSLGLSNAEVNYWAYSLHLQWNYFDHPPAIAWLIRMTTANLLLHNEVFGRLGAIISSAICSWLIFKIGTIINNLQTGWFAALLYNSSMYCSIVAGNFILPDSPQMVFWLFGVLLLLRISHLTSANSQNIYCGVCLVVYHKWLKQPGIYLAAVITLIIISPIFIWNLQNHFITYQSYSSRVTLAGARMNVGGFIKELIQLLLLLILSTFLLFTATFYGLSKEKFPLIKKIFNYCCFVACHLLW